MATSVLNYEVREVIKRTKDDNRHAKTIGKVLEVNPKQRYGHATKEYKSIDEALSEYELITDFYAPVGAYLNDDSIEWDKEVVKYINEHIGTVHMTPEHYFIPVAETTQRKCKVLKTAETTMKERYDDLCKRRSQLNTMHATVMLESDEVTPKIDALRSELENGTISWTDSIKLWQLERIHRECAHTMETAENGITSLNGQICHILGNRFYVTHEIKSTPKSGEQKMVGYTVWDSNRDCVFTVKTCAAGSTKVPTNTYTPKILSELVMEQAIATNVHRTSDHVYYSFKFKPIKRTEVKTA